MYEIIQALECNATNGKENFAYITEKKVMAMKELSKRENQEFTNLQQENERLNNIINELEEWLKYEWYEMSSDFNLGDVISKLEELKEKNNDNNKDNR